jgi:hypothetical protein
MFIIDPRHPWPLEQRLAVGGVLDLARAALIHPELFTANARSAAASLLRSVERWLAEKEPKA